MEFNMSLQNKDFIDPRRKILDILDEFLGGPISPAWQEQIENNLIQNLGLSLSNTNNLIEG